MQRLKPSIGAFLVTILTLILVNAIENSEASTSAVVNEERTYECRKRYIVCICRQVFKYMTGRSWICGAGIISALGYALWRIWRFTVNPRLDPCEPKRYTYWIPGLGNTLLMLRDPQRLVDDARRHFGDTREPFTISALGYKFYFITHPKHVGEVYRNTNTLTHDIFLEDLMKQFKVSKRGRSLVFFRPDSQGQGLQLLSPNPKYSSLARLTVDMFREQMAPGDKLRRLGEITKASIEPLTRFCTMVSPRYLLQEEEDYRDISLLHWCEDTMLRTANQVFFGKSLHRVAPNIIEHFIKFDELSYCAIFQYPPVLSRMLGMSKARDVLIEDIYRYFRLPLQEREDRNWFIDQQERELLNLGFKSEDMARVIAMTFWVVNTNVYKMLFWMVCYLLQDEVLTQQVANELRSCFDQHGNLNVEELTQKGMTGMPFTTALWYEVLRLTNSSSSARFVTTDTIIGGLTMRAGNRLIVPYRQLHTNTEVFGQDPMQFDVMRWLRNDNLERNPSYRPFGGGIWYCPGRHLAKQEIFMALGYLLYRYDVEVAPVGTGIGKKADAAAGSRRSMPRMDEAKPGIGIVCPMAGDDLVLRLRKRDC